MSNPWETGPLVSRADVIDASNAQSSPGEEVPPTAVQKETNALENASELHSDKTAAPEKPFDSRMIDMFPIGEARRHCVDLFVSGVKNLQKRVEEAIRSGIQKEINLACHTLLGVAGNFGAANVSSWCAFYEGRKTEEHEWPAALQNLEERLEGVYAILESKCREQPSRRHRSRQ